MVNYTPNLLNFRTFIWYFLTTQLWKTPQQRLRRKQLSSHDHNTNTTSESLTWKEKKRRWEPKKRKGGRISVSEKKEEVQDGWVTGLSLWMSQLIPATNSWGERQSWKSAAIHKTKKTKRKERERGRRTEGGREKELWTGGLSRRRLSEVFPEPATALRCEF